MFPIAIGRCADSFGCADLLMLYGFLKAITNLDYNNFRMESKYIIIFFDSIRDMQKNSGLILKFKINSYTILSAPIGVQPYGFHPTLKPCNFKIEYSVISKFVLLFLGKYKSCGANLYFEIKTELLHLNT